MIKAKTSLLGKHYWYQQTFKGLPVIDGYYAKHVTKDGGVEIADGRDAVPANLDVSAKVAPATFVYQRQNDKFEQVMAYYHVNQAQECIHQLGFTDANKESQDFSIDTFADDNSFSDPSTDMSTMGEGDVDDAEVIWHE